MSQKTKRIFSVELKLETARLVVDEKYSVQEATKAMNIGLSTMNRWARQLKNKHEGIYLMLIQLHLNRLKSEL